MTCLTTFLISISQVPQLTWFTRGAGNLTTYFPAVYFHISHLIFLWNTRFIHTDQVAQSSFCHTKLSHLVQHNDQYYFNLHRNALRRKNVHWGARCIGRGCLPPLLQLETPILFQFLKFNSNSLLIFKPFYLYNRGARGIARGCFPPFVQSSSTSRSPLPLRYRGDDCPGIILNFIRFGMWGEGFP